jgi:hypothetical protein
VFEQEKTVHVLGRAAAVNGGVVCGYEWEEAGKEAVCSYPRIFLDGAVRHRK